MGGNMVRLRFIQAFIVAACFACVLFLHGCAEKKIDERFSTPKKTYEIWLDASIKGDIPAGMECITKASQKFMEIETKGRSIFMERMVQSAQVFKDYPVADEVIKGDKAVVVIREPRSGSAIAVPFQYEDGGWKVDLIAMFSGLVRGSN